MILGIGIDLVDVDAFREQLGDPASFFVSQVFTAVERAAAAGRASRDPARHLAARWAAKEALVKAWSASRWGKPPVETSLDWHEIEVERDTWGRPALCLHGRVARCLAEAGLERAHLSLSHDGGHAVAVVLLEGTPPGGNP